MHLGHRGGYRFWFAGFALLIVTTSTISLLGFAAWLHRSGGSPRVTSASTDRFIYLTDDGSSTELWLGAAGVQTDRQLLTSVQHVPGWSGVAAVSPDGRSVAYTRLPIGAANPDSDAELWWLRIGDRGTALLAAGVDLRSTLVWSRDNSAVLYRRNEPGREQIWSQKLSGGAAQLLAEPPAGTSILPIDFQESSGLLCAVFDASGTTVARISAGGNEQILSHVSDGAVRDIALSPDKRRLAYLSFDTKAAEPAVSHAGILDLGSGISRMLPAVWGEIVGLSWLPNSTLLVGADGPSTVLHTEDGETFLRETDRGFDQPLASSPSGQAIAARHFSGPTAAQPGAAADRILTAGRPAVSVADGTPAQFVGWLSATHGSKGNE